MSLSKAGLLVVVFVDVAGQGLIFPIIATLLNDPQSGLLPASASDGTRRLYYGITLGTFFLAWFLGAIYISRLSDSIGRRNGILLCLAGALAGYVLTILALAWGSLWLLILGRAITGFTAGNQPIAQAALADLSRDDAEKARNMGYAVAAMSFGLVGGPLIAGALSDTAILGTWASVSLPFYAAIVMVLAAAALILLGFRDTTTERAPLTIGPLEVFRQIWRVTQNPTVLRISLVFLPYMTVSTAFYVFMDEYLAARFGLGTGGTSMAMLVFGAAVAGASATLVGPDQRPLFAPGDRAGRGAGDRRVRRALRRHRIGGRELCRHRAHRHGLGHRLPDLPGHLFGERGRDRAGLGDGCLDRLLHPERRRGVAGGRQPDGARHPCALRHRGRRSGGDAAAGRPAVARPGAAPPDRTPGGLRTPWSGCPTRW